MTVLLSKPVAEHDQAIRLRDKGFVSKAEIIAPPDGPEFVASGAFAHEQRNIVCLSKTVDKVARASYDAFACRTIGVADEMKSAMKIKDAGLRKRGRNIRQVEPVVGAPEVINESGALTGHNCPVDQEVVIGGAHNVVLAKSTPKAQEG